MTERRLSQERELERNFKSIHVMVFLRFCGRVCKVCAKIILRL